MRRGRIGLAVIGLAFAIAACSGPTGTSTPGAPDSATPAATATPAPTATAAPTATPSPSPSASPSPAPLDADDWPVYHLDAGRSGNSGRFAAATFPLSQAWTAKLDGAVYAEPLVIHSRLLVATENDSVYSLDPTTGGVLWRTNLGTPVPLRTLPCGDIDPLGITGTPAFDPLTGSVFAVAEVTGPKHVLFALDPDTGAIRWSRDIDLAGDEPATHQQRPALAVANGNVYVGLGGLAGDCGRYVGEVVGVPTSGSGQTIAYRVPVQREGAVWATGGPVLDAAGNLYVSVGNGDSTSKFDGSDSVVELSPSLERLSYFAPSIWAADNAGDRDLGSVNPTLLPNGYVFIAGKSGIGYSLRQGALGGIGGQVAQAPVCAGFGGTAFDGDVVYLPCSSGLARVTVGATGKIAVDWRSSSGAVASPVVGGGAVWSVDIGAGILFALDPSTGKSLGSVKLGSVPHFVSPTLWRQLVFVGTTSGIVAIHG